MGREKWAKLSANKWSFAIEQQRQRPDSLSIGSRPTNVRATQILPGINGLMITTVRREGQAEKRRCYLQSKWMIKVKEIVARLNSAMSNNLPLSPSQTIRRCKTETTLELDPKKYELFVKAWYEALLNEQHIDIEHRKRFLGRRTGQWYEVDLSYKFTQAGLTFWVIIECKYYSRSVDVGPVLELVAKLDDLGAHKGVLVTTKGFQEGAVRIAEAHGIALLLLSSDQAFRVGSYNGPPDARMRIGELPQFTAPTLSAQTSRSPWEEPLKAWLRFSLKEDELTIQHQERLFSQLWARSVKFIDSSSLDDVKKAIYHIQRLCQYESYLELYLAELFLYAGQCESNGMQPVAVNHYTKSIDLSRGCSQRGGVGLRPREILAYASVCRAQTLAELAQYSSARKDYNTAIGIFAYFAKTQPEYGSVLAKVKASRELLLSQLS